MTQLDQFTQVAKAIVDTLNADFNAEEVYVILCLAQAGALANSMVIEEAYEDIDDQALDVAYLREQNR